jgi:hypothetical protein
MITEIGQGDRGSRVQAIWRRDDRGVRHFSGGGKLGPVRVDLGWVNAELRGETGPSFGIGLGYGNDGAGAGSHRVAGISLSAQPRADDR